VDDARWPSDWLRGVLELCVLGALRAGPSYGYAIAQDLESAGLGPVKGGTLYPLLGRLEAEQLVEASWRVGDSGPGRKYFALTGPDARRCASGPRGGRSSSRSPLRSCTRPSPREDAHERLRTAAGHRRRVAVGAGAGPASAGRAGRRIGEVLAEVEAHCADSGQSPAEAFGDPEAYAAEVTPGWQPPRARSWLLQAVATPLGVTALLSGAAASGAQRWGDRHRGRAAVRRGHRRADRHRRRSARRRPAGALARVAGPSARHSSRWPACPSCCRRLLGTVPAGSLLVTGTLLLAVVWWRSRGASAQGDEVVDPRTAHRCTRRPPGPRWW
jgi:PadR family transcriptional regulator PadR